MSLQMPAENQSEKELATKLFEAQQQVSVGSEYVHYRNKDLKYKVLAIALLESSEDISVVYQAEYGSHLIWVRPLDNWLSEVDFEGKSVPRFQLLG